MEVLVTGGTGFLGNISRGRYWRRATACISWAVTFQAGPRELIAGGAIPITADLRDRAAVDAACAGIEVVFHTGALSAPWGKLVDFHDINVGGTEAVLAGCLARGVGHLIYVSSPSVVFDGRDQRLALEDVPSPHRFTSTYSLTKKLRRRPASMRQQRLASKP